MAHIELKVGRVRAVLLDCGAFRYDGGVIFGAVPKTSWEAQYPADAENRIAVALRPLLVMQDEGHFLVNTGLPEDDPALLCDPAGPKSVRRALSDVGVRPEEIAAVVLTHLHPDHVGGNLVDGVRLAFPRAQYLAQRAEVAAAAYPNERTRADYDPDQVRVLERLGALRVVSGRLRLNNGVTIVPAPGHTPGHQCIRVADGATSALYVSDLAMVPVQAERLTWISALDTQPMRSLESKRELLGRAVEEESVLLFEHEPEEARAVGRLLPDGKRWRYEAGPPQPAAQS